MNRSKAQSGHILVELAIVSPIIMLVIVAMVGLGLAGQKKALVARAASAAARVAIVRPELAAAEALAVMETAADSVRSRDVETTVEPTRVSALPFSRPIRVSVTYKYKPISGFGWRPFFTLRSEFIAHQYTNPLWVDVPQSSGPALKYR